MGSVMNNKNLAQWKDQWDVMTDDQRQQCIQQALQERTPEEVAMDQAEMDEVLMFIKKMKVGTCFLPS